MKTKPIYIYAVIAIVVVVLLIILNTGNNETREASSNIKNEMPQDDIHKGMSNEEGQSPSKGNVRAEFYEMLYKLEKEVESNPDDTLKIREYAEYLRLAHQIEKALIEYEKILSIDPNRIDVLLTEGLIYFNSGNLEKAELVTTRILEINENHLDAKFNLGTIAATKGESERARKIWTELINEHPNSEAARLAKEAISNLQ